MLKQLEFIKMHGLGNDFVIVDFRDSAINAPNDGGLARAAKHICDRKAGIGCDQFIVLTPSKDSAAAAHLQFFNPDGSQAAACGNGTRCVAALLFDRMDQKTNKITLTTLRGQLHAMDHRQANGDIAVDMGAPIFNWQQIPLAYNPDSLIHLPIHLPDGEDQGLGAVGVGFGNPHAVFMVEDAEKIDIEKIAPALETHPLFPQRANIGFVSARGNNIFRLIVWERGAGRTLACGSGASAASVAVTRRGLVKAADRSNVMISFIVDGSLRYPQHDGSPSYLKTCWRADDQHIELSGATAHSFSGHLDLNFN
ncbi:MAG: diaminopimelate epimerase [Alphaproteobacteria bacterium]